MTRLLLRGVPKVGLGYDGVELALGGGFRGLRGVAPGFHRIELIAGDRRVALHVAIGRSDEVRAFALRGDRLAPAPSALDAAAGVGALDGALFDVARLPAAPTWAWRTLTSQLTRVEDAAAWRAIAPPVDRAAWQAADVRVIVGLQGAWLAMSHDHDHDAAAWLATLCHGCAAVERAAVARHPAIFAALLDGFAAIRLVAGELAHGLIASIAPLIALCAGHPATAPAVARLARSGP